MVRSNQLVMAVIRLTTSRVSLSFHRALRQLLRPVHPVYARIDVVFITSADLQNARYPVVLGLGPLQDLLGLVGICRAFRCGLLALDCLVVCDIDKPLTEILRPVY